MTLNHAPPRRRPDWPGWNCLEEVREEEVVKARELKGESRRAQSSRLKAESPRMRARGLKAESYDVMSGG
ncbi:MAG: hypothetical protein V2A69_02610 [Pseudomonadota bacterium]